MFKNQYNTNPIIFSPDGQILQLNYANKASERGNLIVSIKSKNHLVIMGTLKLEKLYPSKENKVLTFGNNLSVVMTGVSKDGKFLGDIITRKKYENENSANRYCQTPDIASFCSKIIGRNTYYSNLRPFGIKMILVGYDSTGPSIFDFNCDGSFQRRMFSAKGKDSIKILAYIDQFSNKLEDFSWDELLLKTILIYIESFKNSEKKKINGDSIFLSLLGKNAEMFILKENMVSFYLKLHQKMEYKFENKYIKSFANSNNYEIDSGVDSSTFDSDPWPIEYN